jgi:sRNA-binding carbon storage regulator CsrA
VSGIDLQIAVRSGNRVLVGIETPIHIPVNREEIYLRKRQERSNASDAQADVRGLAPNRHGRALGPLLPFRADSYLADVRQRPSEREAVIRLSAHGVDAELGDIRNRDSGGAV